MDSSDMLNSILSKQQAASIPGHDPQAQVPGLSQNPSGWDSAGASGDPQVMDPWLLAGGDQNGANGLWSQGQIGGLAGLGLGLDTGNPTKEWPPGGLAANPPSRAALQTRILANQPSLWSGNGTWGGGQEAQLPDPTATALNADEPHRLAGFASLATGVNLNQGTGDLRFPGFPAASLNYAMPGSNAMAGNFHSQLDFTRPDDVQRILQGQELLRLEQRRMEQMQQNQQALQDQQRLNALEMQMKALGVGNGLSVGPGSVNEAAMMLYLSNQAAMQNGMNGMGNFGMSGLHGGLGNGGVNMPSGRPMHLNDIGGRAQLNFAMQHQMRQMEQHRPAMRGSMYGMMPGSRVGQDYVHRHGNHGRRTHQRHGPPPPPPPPMATRAPVATTTKPTLSRVALNNTPRPAAPDSPGRDWAYQKDARPKVEMPILNDMLIKAVSGLQPTAEERADHEKAFKFVKDMLLEKWPEAKVHLFGSWANGLSITNCNDMDVCLEIEGLPDEQASKADIVIKMTAMMQEKDVEVLGLPKARVPVVKLIVPGTKTRVDVVVNDILALVNTKLLGDYCKIDERLVQLATIVKTWAKNRQVNDSYRGSLSSYCYVLMCIHLLQQRDVPILPCLQSITPPTVSRLVGPWKCEYMDNVELVKDFGKKNTETLAELVWAFFEYWAWKHDYNNNVVSVRTGGFLTKGQKEWTRRVGNERHLVCIEDPFELTHDLGRTIDRATSGVLHKEFERAACCLRDSEKPIEKLFETFRSAAKEGQ